MHYGSEPLVSLFSLLADKNTKFDICLENGQWKAAIESAQGHSLTFKPVELHKLAADVLMVGGGAAALPIIKRIENLQVELDKKVDAQAQLDQKEFALAVLAI